MRYASLVYPCMHISLVYKRYERDTIGGSTPLLYLLYPNILHALYIRSKWYRGTSVTRGTMRVHLLQGALGVCGTGASTRGTVNIKTIMGTRDTMLYLLHPLYIRDT